MDTAPFFYEHAPTVEVRGDMAFIENGNDRRSCMRLSTARAFYRRLGSALAMHDSPPGNIVQLQAGSA
jgi:hypothetical protein